MNKSMLETDTDATISALAETISLSIGEEYGFGLIIFPFNNNGGVSTYISNGHRKDMAIALRAQADLLEKDKGEYINKHGEKINVN